MKIFISAVLLLVSTIVVAAPFEENYGIYDVQSCRQYGNYRLIDFCTNAKTVQLLPVSGATEFRLVKEVGNYFAGVIGLQFQDRSINPKASYLSENGTTTLI